MYNILVCDDDKDIVSALKIYLCAEGYKVFEAYNGLEAVKTVEKEEVHLVLLDIMMPQMDGIAAISKIREISNVPVILLTAKSEDTDKILGLNMGADDYVTKPFNPVEVMARVRSNIRRYIQLGGGEGVLSGGVFAGVNDLGGDVCLSVVHGQREDGTAAHTGHHIGAVFGIFGFFPGEEGEHHLLGRVMIAVGFPQRIGVKVEFHIRT